MPLGTCATEALGNPQLNVVPSWAMAAPALNLFGRYSEHLSPPSSELLGQAPEGQQGLLFAGSAFGLHGLSQEHEEYVRQITQRAEQGREAHARIQHAFDTAAASAAGGTNQHTGMLTPAQSLSPPPLTSQQSSSPPAGFAHSSVSVPHTPIKPFEGCLASISTSALSTPTSGSISLASIGNSVVDSTSPSLHSGSQMAPPRPMLPPPDHHMLVSQASLMSIHSSTPGQAAPNQGQNAPPPQHATPNITPTVGKNALPSGSGGISPSGCAGGQGQLTLAFANTLAQAAAERGVDSATLVQLLQSPKLVDLLLSKIGDFQVQHQQVSHTTLQTTLPPPPPPPPPKPSPLQTRMSAPTPGEWSHHPSVGLNASSGVIQHFRPPPPPPPRPPPAASAAATGPAAGAAPMPYVSLGTNSSGGSGSSTSSGGASVCSSGGSGSSSNSSSLDTVQGVALPGPFSQELGAARSVLVQLMLSAYAFLNSDSMRDFYEKLLPVSSLYDEMHELPVVQKRNRCREMSYLRGQLMQDPAFAQILQAVVALRHHLHSLSRRVLMMSQGPDGIPIDLLLGSMSTELFHVLKGALPQEVCDYFGNCLPHPRLAVLVFAEFTSVDPMPSLA